MSPDTREPLASVILPAYNSAEGLPAAIESILCQTYQNFELIIVDDGSTDTLPEVLAGWTDPRMVFIRHPEQYGVARACNSGMRAARGELIGFISSGDTWDNRKLEEQVDAFTRLPPEYGVVYCDVWEITPAGNRAYWHSPEMTDPELLNSYATGFEAGALGTGPLLVRRSFLNCTGPFDELFRCFSDTDMIIRLQRVCRFHHIRKPLCHCRSRLAYAANPFDRSISQLLLMQKYPETLENPVFVTQQIEIIRRNLLRAQEAILPVSERVRQGQEQGHYRQPVPES